MLDQQREIENYVLSRPLAEINHPENLQFLAALIQNHDHLREKLLTEPNPRQRREKLEAMRPYLRFKPDTAANYELAELARSNGVQPIYREQQEMEERRIWMPDSRIHEVS